MVQKVHLYCLALQYSWLCCSTVQLMMLCPGTPTTRPPSTCTCCCWRRTATPASSARTTTRRCSPTPSTRAAPGRGSSTSPRSGRRSPRTSLHTPRGRRGRADPTVSSKREGLSRLIVRCVKHSSLYTILEQSRVLKIVTAKILKIVFSFRNKSRGFWYLRHGWDARKRGWEDTS